MKKNEPFSQGTLNKNTSFDKNAFLAYLLVKYIENPLRIKDQIHNLTKRDLLAVEEVQLLDSDLNLKLEQINFNEPADLEIDYSNIQKLSNLRLQIELTILFYFYNTYFVYIPS